MKNASNLKAIQRIAGLIAIAAVIGFTFAACSGGDNGGGGRDEYEEPVVLTMRFNEHVWIDDDGNITGGWFEHDDWGKWIYEYHDENNLFDLADMYVNNRVLIFSWSFRSDIDVDYFGSQIFNLGEPDWYWKRISDYAHIKSDILKNTRYSGKVVYFPNGDAVDCLPEITSLEFDIGNRTVAAPPTLSFYQFSFEEVDKENGLNKWTVSGKDFTIDKKTFAEKVTFDGKADVLHIRPAYNISYDWEPIGYDLSAYAGKTIEIEMSMDAYLKKPAWIAWQINSSTPDAPVPAYPVICGTVRENDEDSPTSPALTANIWHHITGKNYIRVPKTGDRGKTLYLSGWEIQDAEAYFANATIKIDTNPDSNEKGSVDDFKDDEPNMGENKSRGDVRKGGTVTIKIPSPLPPAGPATFAVDPADTLIAKINSQTGTDCVVQGLEIGTARIKVTVGSQNAIVIISILPDQTGTYKLPSGGGKKLGTYTTWDNGVANRPGDLPSDYANYTAEPTTQLAWNWRNKGGSHGASGGDCGIDFLAYYVDPTNSNKRGWVRTTYDFAGWHYDLNDKTNNMTNGVQTEGNIRLELTPEFVYDNGVPYLQITHRLTNTGSSKVTNQKFGASADIMLYGNDYAPLKYMKYGALMTNATTAAPNPTIKFRLVCQNVTGVDNVSTLWMGEFPGERRYVYVDKRGDVTGIDSAMNFSYRNIDLNAGESKTFVVRFTQIQ